MSNIIRVLWKKGALFFLLALVLLCGCSSLQASQASTTPTPKNQHVSSTPTSPTPTTASQPTSPTPTSSSQPTASTPTTSTQPAFTSYVNKWQVHGSLLTINTNQTGLELWNAGPCAQQMCNGNADIIFTENADGSIKGTILSVNYSQWSGGSAPTGFQAAPTDPQAGDTFQLQHSGAHLLYTTWFGAKSSLNSNNRYWCDAYALKSGWQQCGA